MSTPAERFAAANQRAQHPLTQEFAAKQRFALDPFQVAACETLEDGQGVLVAAPTGAGKTIVGEFAIFLAMDTQHKKAFYTTPMKALSNQKYRELCEVYGADHVGLLTGDTNINSDARVVVMTTEVLRNMIYADSAALRDLAFVVMDEVHYLADRFRGAVWEEVILHLPKAVRVVALSATVSNAEEFGDWLDTVRGNTAVIVSEVRPVPLEQHVLVRGDLLPLFDERAGAAAAQVNQELMRVRGGSRALSYENNARTMAQRRGGKRGKPGYRSHGSKPQRMERLDRPGVVELLESEQLLPAIFFIFSRVGCEAAVTQCRRADIVLTTPEERAEILATAQERTRTLPDEDLAALGYWEWLDDLCHGFASHHAGLLPVFKEVVEDLFQRKLVRVVFATETLALGINMPARTVVLEKLEKFNGEARVAITSGEYTQLTGRAGRRGIDVEGHAVVQYVEGFDPAAVAALASRRTYPLHSSFRPTYNMAVNLIDRFGRARAREVLESSFAQFQADRSVVDIATRVREADQSLRGYEEAMQCDLGNFKEYSRWRRDLTDSERRVRGDGESRGKREKRLKDIDSLRRRLQRHPCHRCPDREAHARWAERYWKLQRETERLRRQIEQRTGTVARQFDRVTRVLEQVDYIRIEPDGSAKLTPAGATMRQIYGERDLLIAECLRLDLWRRLDAPSLAALACALVYEPRRDEHGERGLPRGAFREVFTATERLWSELDDLERDFELPGTEPPSPGLSLAMHEWARGGALDRVLRDADLAAGDFVRWTKQTIDLLDQISIVATGELATTARSAIDAIRRGIVVYTGL